MSLAGAVVLMGVKPSVQTGGAVGAVLHPVRITIDRESRHRVNGFNVIAGLCVMIQFYYR